MTTTLVGRDREMAELLDRWSDAEEGRGGVALVVGEPGNDPDPSRPVARRVEA